MATTVKKQGNVGIEYNGSAIVLPVVSGRPMPIKSAIEALMRQMESDEKMISLNEHFKHDPLDCAVAFSKAMQRTFGYVSSEDTQTFFGPRPPAFVNINISPTETITIPTGTMQVAGIDGEFNAIIHKTGFHLLTKIKRKHEQTVRDIIALTNKIVLEESIYRGKAIKVSFEWLREERDFDPRADAPRFWELSQKLESELIYSEETMNAVNVSLFYPIEYRSACRENGVPAKRGILLHGMYGTGKTLAAHVAAIKAVRNGWTFLYLDDVRDLKEALDMAQKYAPCVLFAEDLDRVLTGGRTPEMDQILNTLDGVDTKNGEIIAVFTSNDITEINPAALRMGRLDAVIEVTAPDATAATNLVRQYSRGLLDPATEQNLISIGTRLAGKIPAFIREVCERAKIATIGRVGSADIKGKVLEIDLLKASDAMESHHKLLNPDSDKSKEYRPEIFMRLPEKNGNKALVSDVLKFRAREFAEDIKVSIPATASNGDNVQ